jgi:hypothetical protein
VPLGEQSGHHRVAAHVVGIGVQQLLQLVEEQAHDAGLGGVQPGDDVPATRSTKGFHASFW